jgi:hypothetical protein
MRQQGATTGRHRSGFSKPDAAWLFAAIAVLVTLQLASFAYDRLPSAGQIETAVQDAIGQAWVICQ